MRTTDNTRKIKTGVEQDASNPSHYCVVEIVHQLGGKSSNGMSKKTKTEETLKSFLDKAS